MTRYLLIESRDPFECNEVAQFYELARNLAAHGNGVTLFLAQNGVLPARPSTGSAPLSDLSQAGVQVLADSFSLAERGIDRAGLAPGIEPAALDVVVDHLAGGGKAIWH